MSAAKFYKVEEHVITMAIQRHRDELEGDGLKVIKGEELTNLKLFSKAYGRIRLADFP